MKTLTASDDTMMSTIIERDRSASGRKITLALFRILMLAGITVFHIFQYLCICLIKGFSPERAAKETLRWCRSLIHNLNIGVTVQGTAPSHAALVVSNHRSYIDIPVIGSYFPSSFLAKMELKKWPLLGQAAQLANVVFVRRSDAKSRQEAREAIKKQIMSGCSIIVFPEGTSYEGPGILDFKPGVFQLAAESEIPIIPVAINYADPAAAWVDDDTFISHFMRTFSKKSVQVFVTFGPPINGSDPALLHKQSWEWINRHTRYHHIS